MKTGSFNYPPRYSVDFIPAGKKVSIHGLTDAGSKYEAPFLPARYAVLDNCWRIWSDKKQEWIKIPFPWVIIGSKECCENWIKEHKYDDYVME